MKKLIIVSLTAVLLVAGFTVSWVWSHHGHGDEPSDYHSVYHFLDADEDGICDICGMEYSKHESEWCGCCWHHSHHEE